MSVPRILVVEDEQIVAADIAAILERLGYTVAPCAKDAAEAFAQIEQDPPDLILMDIHLNGNLDGIQAAQAIRERWHLPVVYITAYADQATIERARVTEPLGFIHKPIDERKLASSITMALYKHASDQRLRTSVLRLSAIFESISDLLITTTADGLIDYLNPVARNLLRGAVTNPPDASDALFTGRFLFDCCSLRPALNDAEPMSWAEFTAIPETEATELWLTSSVGTRHLMEIHLTPLGRQTGALTGYTIVGHDVTEHQKTLKALRSSERKYRSMLEAMQDMVYICNSERQIEYMNPAMISFLGRDATGERCFKAIYGKDEPCPWCPSATISHDCNRQSEITCPTTGHTFRIACATIIGELQSSSHMMIVTDITERKQAEVALQESETRYKRLVASLTDYIYSVKVENGRALSTFHGPGCIAVTGYSTADYDTDPDLWFKMVHTEDRKKVLSQAQKLLAGEAAQPLEHRIVHKSGSICWVRNTPVVHRDAQGQVIAYDGLVANITDRKVAEAEISEHARKLEIINRIIVSVNKAKDLTGTLEEVLMLALDLLKLRGGCIYLINAEGQAEMRCANGLPATFITSMSHLDVNDQQYGDLFTAGRAQFMHNCRRTAPEWARRWQIGAMARVPLVTTGQVIGMLMITNPTPRVFTMAEQDLLRSIASQMGTALAKAESEDALRESENRYRTITEQSLVGVQIIKDGHLVFVNDGWSEITGYTRHDIERWDDRDFLRIVHPDDQHFFLDFLNVKNTLADGSRKVYDCRFFALSGATKWVSLHARTVHFADGPAVIAIIVDITDRKLAEQALAAANRRLQSREEQLRTINQELFTANEELKASESELMNANREKEMLLKEIHHRVKNNLQVISSLLKLQITHVSDETARHVIRECQNRIKSIAIVHEKLYQSPSLADINISEYIQMLVKHLFRTFLIDPASIRTDIRVADVSMGIDKAIPCSLVINELVSNSLKYAFLPTGVGTITIHLQTGADGRCILNVADDGCGLPKDLDFRNTATLGMQLVMTFVEQLGGEISLDRTHGTRFTIIFENDKKNRDGNN